MKGNGRMKFKRKTLFTTAYRKRKLYDYLRANSRWKFFRYVWVRVCSYGLRFIKQNVLQIEVLEYPTWNHPYIKLKEMEKLLDEYFKIVHPRYRVFQTTLTWGKIFYKVRNPFSWLTFITSMVIKANLFNYPKLRFCR